MKNIFAILPLFLFCFAAYAQDIVTIGIDTTDYIRGTTTTQRIAVGNGTSSITGYSNFLWDGTGLLSGVTSRVSGLTAGTPAHNFSSSVVVGSSAASSTQVGGGRMYLRRAYSPLIAFEITGEDFYRFARGSDGGFAATVMELTRGLSTTLNNQDGLVLNSSTANASDTSRNSLRLYLTSQRWDGAKEQAEGFYLQTIRTSASEDANYLKLSYWDNGSTQTDEIFEVSPSGVVTFNYVPSIPITDAGGYFEATQVEAALQEIGAKIETIDATIRIDRDTINAGTTVNLGKMVILTANGITLSSDTAFVLDAGRYVITLDGAARSLGATGGQISTNLSGSGISAVGNAIYGYAPGSSLFFNSFSNNWIIDVSSDNTVVTVSFAGDASENIDMRGAKISIHRTSN